MERLQSRTDIINLIQNVSQLCDIKNGEIKSVATNQKGEGYLGEIFFVSINDQVSKKQLDLVIKVAFNDEKLRESVPIHDTFANEIYAYTTVFPKFHQFLKTNGLNCDHYKFVPKCYQVSTENLSEVVILENLHVNGFELFDKYSILDDDHIALIFKTYGHFHGISLALKDLHSEEYEQVSNKINNDIFLLLIRAFKLPDYLSELAKSVESCFSEQEDDGIRKAFQKYIINTENVLKESMDSNCKNSVVLQGDCWSNNMMFKYDSISKKPIDIRLLDLQMIKTGNPVCDLSYALYSGASREVFDKLDDYLLIYHRALSDIIRKLGSNPENLLTLEDLKNDWKQYAKFGFLMSLLIIRMRLTKQDDVLDLNDVAGVDDKAELLHVEFDKKTFAVRVSDVVRHMYNYGAL